MTIRRRLTIIIGLDVNPPSSIGTGGRPPNAIYPSSSGSVLLSPALGKAILKTGGTEPRCHMFVKTGL